MNVDRGANQHSKSVSVPFGARNNLNWLVQCTQSPFSCQYWRRKVRAYEIKSCREYERTLVDIECYASNCFEQKKVETYSSSVRRVTLKDNYKS